MDKILRLNIGSVIGDLNRKLILDCAVGTEFILYNDIIKSATSIIHAGGPTKFTNLPSIGCSTEEDDEIPRLGSEFILIPAAIFQPKIQANPISYPLDALYNILSNFQTPILTIFGSPNLKDVTRLKHDAEDRISRIEVRQSSSISEMRKNSSASTDLYYHSYEKRILGMILENITDILISKCSAYKVAFAVECNQHTGDIIKYLKSNSIALSQKKIRINKFSDFFDNLRRTESIPLSYANASQALALSPRIRRIAKIDTVSQLSSGDISIGNYIDSAITETTERVLISSKAMNLGTLITGLPGTGKTSSAKGIIEQAIKTGSKVTVMSPTAEWNAFGNKNSLNVIKIGDPWVNLNLFKCETGNTKKFYENLSMLIASGCNSGPYKNSVEKCLLSAFSRVYSSTNNPDPQRAYEEIEESIIEQHGKRTLTSVKYTKHGENTRAALESLRQLLMMPQFAYSESVSIARLMDKGTVFDLSGISNNSKPLLYALLLNQLYNFFDEFDLNGDNQLRLILCLEEAQLVFNAENEQGATSDLRERIQNFRKTGIGIILITHNITDINPSIRRLCQNKMYFRQSSDIAKYAASDLIFNEKDYDKIISILKTLGQRECAISAITINNGQKTVSNSLFSKTDEYKEPEGVSNARPEMPTPVPTKIRIISEKDPQTLRYKIDYLGGNIASGSTNSNEILQENLLNGKIYKLKIIGEKKRDDKEFRITGAEENTIRL